MKWVLALNMEYVIFVTFKLTNWRFQFVQLLFMAKKLIANRAFFLFILVMYNTFSNFVYMILPINDSSISFLIENIVCNQICYSGQCKPY